MELVFNYSGHLPIHLELIELFNTITILEQETGNVFYSITPSIVVSSLHPYYTYKCTVSAVTIGNGPVASLVIQMPEEGL